MKKLFILCIMAMYAFASTAQSTQVIYATTTPSSQTFNHPNANGNNAPTTLSGYITAFHAFVFTAPVSGIYSFEANSPAVDNFGVLYTYPFNPAQPLTNALVANDGSSFNSGDNFLITRSLTAGTTYVLVTTTFYPGEYGTVPVTITGPFTTSLPVDMSDLTASVKNELVELSWITYSELNSKGFYIQKSSDGKEFNNIGYVYAKAEGQNLTTSYSYVDSKTAAINFYRIAQEDLNGKISYSNIVKVMLDSKLAHVDVFPNPSSDALNITYALIKESHVNIQLTDIYGRIVYSSQISKQQGVHQDKISLSHLASGQYTLQLFVSGNKTYSSIISKQ